MVLEVDPEKRRISLGLKQCLGNPWEAFVEQHPVGTIVEGEVRNITEFGLFVGLDHDIDGMVHLSDLDWAAAGRGGGQEVHQGRHGPRPGARRRRREGAHLAGHQAARRGPVQGRRPPASRRATGSPAPSRRSTAGGIEVETTTRCHRLHPQGRARPRPRRAAPGAVRPGREARRQGDERRRRPAAGSALSVKALEIEDEKQAMAEFGSSDSGASLGDILGAAFRQKQEEQTKELSQPAGARPGRGCRGRDAHRARPLSLTLRPAFGSVRPKGPPSAGGRRAPRTGSEA